MIKLLETKKTYSIIFEDKVYTLIQDIIEEDEFIEVLLDNEHVDDETWNEIVNMWETLTETND